MTETQYICIGCGVKIQTEDPEKIGYAPKSSLEKRRGLFACPASG